MVVDFPNHYYLGGRYFRPRGSAWQMSTSIAGSWMAADTTQVPPGLLATRGESRGKHIGRGARHGHQD
jgi:hypothetical protein